MQIFFRTHHQLDGTNRRRSSTRRTESGPLRRSGLKITMWKEAKEELRTTPCSSSITRGIRVAILMPTSRRIKVTDGILKLGPWEYTLRSELILPYEAESHFAHKSKSVVHSSSRIDHCRRPHCQEGVRRRLRWFPEWDQLLIGVSRPKSVVVQLYHTLDLINPSETHYENPRGFRMWYLYSMDEFERRDPGNREYSLKTSRERYDYLPVHFYSPSFALNFPNATGSTVLVRSSVPHSPHCSGCCPSSFPRATSGTGNALYTVSHPQPSDSGPGA